MAVPASDATELRFSTKAMPVAAWREEFARGFLRLDIEPEQHDRFQADATIRAFTGLKIDTAPPVVSCAPTPATWTDTQASVACTATDSGAGLEDDADASFTLSTAVPAGTATCRPSMVRLTS